MARRIMAFVCWVVFAPSAVSIDADAFRQDGPARSGAGVPASDADWRGVRVTDPSVSVLIKGALDRAPRRLHEPACQSLLAGSRDQQGQFLVERLATLNTDSHSYLRWIRFHDGNDARVCQNGSTLAFTEPGSRIVRLCSRAIERGGWKEPDYLAVIIIHEMLHTLGLGENPPSSEEITARVRNHCWPR